MKHLPRRAVLFGLFCLGLAGLAGCSNPAKTARYLIDPPAMTDRVPDRLGSAELKDVSLPEYASGQEVAFQTADGAVRSTPKNLWADTPQRAVTLALARAISDASGAVVIGEPWPLAEPPKRVLEVRVERALAQADNVYRLSGRYFVANDRSGASNYARAFDIAVPMGGAGPGATAAALSQAIALLGRQIATLSGPGQAIATTAPADPFALDPLL